MSLSTYYTGVTSTVTRVLSKESVVAVGDGKFVIVLTQNFGDFGYVVCSVDQEGVPTFGSFDYLSGFSAPIPIAYWDKSQEKLVIIYGEYPANKYLICSVSGTVVSVDSSGTMSNITDDSYMAVCYSDVHNKAVICTENVNTDTRFYSLSLAGGVLTATAAPTIIAGYANPKDIKITFCGDYGLVGLTPSFNYPASEVRVLLDVGGAFDISSGYSVPLTDHENCLGLAGTSDGKFTGYWANGTSDIPFVLAGEIASGGGLTFGGVSLQYASTEWGGGLYGENMGMAVGANLGIGIYINRVDGERIHMFVAKNDNLEPEVIEEQTSPDIFSFDNLTDVFVSAAFDVDSGFCLGSFFTSNGNIYVAPLWVDVELPNQVFWTNHTLQREGYVNGQVKKIPTRKIIPGISGQTYVPPTDAVAEKVVVSSGINYLCKRVI